MADEPTPASDHFTCPRCGEIRPRDQMLFRTGGRLRYCRPCGKAYYQANREVLIERTVQWQRDNPEKNRAKNRAHYEANREKLKAYGAEYGKRWNTEHPGSSMERARRRRQRLAQVQTIPYTDGQLSERWDYYEGQCWMCGSAATEMDHVKPIFHLGPDILANLRPACDPCNSGKGWKWPVDTHVHGSVRSTLRPDRVDYIPLHELTAD